MRPNALLQAVMSFILLLKGLFFDERNSHHGVFLSSKLIFILQKLKETRKLLIMLYWLNGLRKPKISYHWIIQGVMKGISHHLERNHYFAWISVFCKCSKEFRQKVNKRGKNRIQRIKLHQKNCMIKKRYQNYQIYRVLETLW